MVAKPENLNRFLFNSDYPTDKIVWLYEGQFTTTDDIDTIEINMANVVGTAAPIFVKGAVTLDDWATSIMIGTNYSQAGKNASVELRYSCYNGQARVLLYPDFRSFPNRTAKYRLWAVQREDIDFAIDYGKNSAVSKSRMKFNSNLNYPRLYKDGVAKSGETIQHDLGKIPYVDYWYQIQNSLVPYTKDNAFNTSYDYNPKGTFKNGIGNYPTIKATSTTISFNKMIVNGNEQRDVFYYYRIYA